MMRQELIFIIALVLALTCVIYSCKDVDGKCEPPKFEQSHRFGKDGGSKIIKANNNVSWSFADLYLGDTLVSWDNDTLKVTRDEVIKTAVVKFESVWFSVEKIDNKTISVVLKETTEPRGFSFSAFVGNCWTDISIEQNIE